MPTQTQQKKRMNEQILQHGKNLNKIFNTQYSPIALCKKLRPLERKLHQLATDYCNGQNAEGQHIDCENIGQWEKPLMQKVYDLLNNGIYEDDRPHQKGVPVFFNGDCRGYAIKINSDYMRLLNKQGKTLYQDWGGFGIIAPDLS